MRSFRYGILPVFVLLAVMLSMFPSHSSAATISVGSAVAIIGGKVKVPVTLSDTGGALVGGVRFYVTYDSLILTPTLDSTCNGGLCNIITDTPGIISSGTISASGIAEGVIANLVFDISPMVAMQQITLPLTTIEYFDTKIQPLSFQSASGSVKIVKAGDCDATGTTSIAEVQSGINMFLGLKSTAACVDFNADGSVSIAEVQKVINTFLGL